MLQKFVTSKQKWEILSNFCCLLKKHRLYDNFRFSQTSNKLLRLLIFNVRSPIQSVTFLKLLIKKIYLLRLIFVSKILGGVVKSGSNVCSDEELKQLTGILIHLFLKHKHPNLYTTKSLGF